MKCVLIITLIAVLAIVYGIMTAGGKTKDYDDPYD